MSKLAFAIAVAEYIIGDMFLGFVGARKVTNMKELKEVFEEDETLIIQELMTEKDLDANVYVDTISGEVISTFLKNTNLCPFYNFKRLFCRYKTAVYMLIYIFPIDCIA